MDGIRDVEEEDLHELEWWDDAVAIFHFLEVGENVYPGFEATLFAEIVDQLADHFGELSLAHKDIIILISVIGPISLAIFASIISLLSDIDVVFFFINILWR